MILDFLCLEALTQSLMKQLGFQIESIIVFYIAFLHLCYM